MHVCVCEKFLNFQVDNTDFLVKKQNNNNLPPNLTTSVKQLHYRKAQGQ